MSIYYMYKCMQVGIKQGSLYQNAGPRRFTARIEGGANVTASLRRVGLKSTIGEWLDLQDLRTTWILAVPGHQLETLGNLE